MTQFTHSLSYPAHNYSRQCKWCIAAAANVAIVVSEIVNVVLYPAVLLHRAPVPAFGLVQVSVVDGWKVSVLPFSVVDEGWNGK